MPSVKDLKAYIKAHHKEHCPPLSKMRKAELLKEADRIKGEMPMAKSLPELPEGGRKSSGVKRAAGPFAKFVSEHKGKGLSLKQLGEMYRSRKGGVEKVVEAAAETVPSTRKLKAAKAAVEESVKPTRKLKASAKAAIAAAKAAEGETVPSIRKLKPQPPRKTRKLKASAKAAIAAAKAAEGETVPRTRKLKSVEVVDESIYGDFTRDAPPKRKLKADIAAAAAAGQMNGGAPIGIVPTAYTDAAPAEVPIKLRRKLKKKD